MVRTKRQFGNGTLFSVVLAAALLPFLIVGCTTCETDDQCTNVGPCEVGTCTDGQCVYTSTCAEGETCNEETNECYVACEAETDCTGAGPCETAACTEGACVYTTTCVDGEVCDETATPPVCVPEGCTDDTHCDDGVFCNGAETCDTTTGDCVAGTDPCAEGETCDEEADVCIADPCAGVECDDADACTTEECVDGECVYTDVVCAEGEVCDPDTGCVAVCVEDADCDDADICNGAETCDVATGECLDGEALDCDDADLCTVDTCDAAAGCVNTAVECEAGFECDPVDGECKEVVCDEDADCDDGEFCNGEETCDTETGECQEGTDPCADVECDGDETPTCTEGDDAAVCECPDVPCEEFTINQDTLSGTTGDDCFKAPLVVPTGTGVQASTLQTGDSANGLAGDDYMDVSFADNAAATTVVATLTGIEVFNLTSYDGTHDVTLTGTNVTGVEEINTVNSVGDINITNLANNVIVGLDGLADATKELNIAWLNGVTTNPFTGTTDELLVNISNTIAGMLDITTATNGFETMEINSTGGSANTFTELTITAGSANLSTVTFTGDTDLNMVLFNAPTGITTVNAADFTGDLFLGTGTEDTTYGEAFNPTSNWAQLTGGSGDDTIVFEDTLTTTDFTSGTVDLGAGTDVVQSTFSATFGAASKMRNIEEARFNATASGISHNFSGWTGLTTITNEEDGTANTFTFSSIPTTTGGTLPVLNYRGDNTQAAQTFDTITYGAASSSGSSDALTITVGNRGTNLNTGTATTNAFTVGPITAASIETINIDVANGPLTVTTGITASTLVTLDVDAPVSNTNTNVTLGTVTTGGTGTTITTVDASEVTGNFSATIDYCAATITITTGAGNDTITIGGNSAAAHNATVNLGNGNNIYVADTTTAGVDTVTCGTGNDSIKPGQGADTITTGTGTDTVNLDNEGTNETSVDTITDFTAGTGGDVVILDVSSLEARDVDGGGGDDLVDWAAATIAGTEAFNLNLVTADNEEMAAGDDLALVDDDLATAATCAALIALGTATIEVNGATTHTAEDIYLLGYADGSGNVRLCIGGDAGGGGANSDTLDSVEDFLILTGVDVDNLVSANFQWQA